ncbi:hypothetical protein IGI04_032136, partial [Brassica rapa subsp. trilocularis]
YAYTTRIDGELHADWWLFTYFVLIHGHARVGRLQRAFQYSTEQLQLHYAYKQELGPWEMGRGCQANCIKRMLDACTRWALFKHLDTEHASREAEFLDNWPVSFLSAYGLMHIGSALIATSSGDNTALRNRSNVVEARYFTWNSFLHASMGLLYTQQRQEE